MIFYRLNKFCESDNPGLVTVNSDHAHIYFVHSQSTLKFRLEWQLVGKLTIALLLVTVRICFCFYF